MLLRSASTPLLNSLIPKESPIEIESLHQIHRPRSLLMLSSSSSSSSSRCYSPVAIHSSDESTRKMKKTASESDLRHLTPPASKFLTGDLVKEDVEEEEGIGFGILRNSLCNWGLEEGGGGGAIHGGGKGRSGGRSGDSDGDGDDSTDLHYRKMIEANPRNAIFLSNYAKFLKEVKKDYMKAEEYCGRAILTNPNDGNVLAMYAELIWKVHKDESRAETYFTRAVSASPDDCYVQASYARFLWDVEEEDEEELETQTSRVDFFTGPSPITAMSS